MRWHKIALVLVIMLIGCTACSSSTQKKNSNTTENIQDPTLKILPSIVKITTTTNEGISEGSGFIIDGQMGYILTATHVLAGTNIYNTRITLRNGQSKQPINAWSYRQKDMAIIHIESLELPEISFGEQAKLGQDLLAIGMVGDSYITASGKVKDIITDNSGEKIMTIETQAEPGMSGGPVVDQYGNGMGIVSLASLDSNEIIAYVLTQSDIDDVVANVNAKLNRD